METTTETMNKELAVTRQESVAMVTGEIPAAYDENRARTLRCVRAGEALLAELSGREMDGDLDRRCAEYLEKTRKTARLMNERRSPVTKIFDQIRAGFTALESEIDASREDSVPGKVRALRDRYAAKLREEAERLRREEERRRRLEQARSAYERDVQEALSVGVDRLVSARIATLASANSSLTLGNWDVQAAIIKEDPSISDARIEELASVATRPYELTETEAHAIRSRVFQSTVGSLRERFLLQVGDYRSLLVDALPEKRRELERMAKADAEERERIKRELAEKEASGAARLEEERRKKSGEDAERRKVAAATVDLFEQAAALEPAYVPRSKVRKRVEVLDKDGVIDIISFWWSKEGQGMEMEDLLKMFKRQVTAVERVANDKDNPEFIKSSHVRYVDEVKAL